MDIRQKTGSKSETSVSKREFNWELAKLIFRVGLLILIIVYIYRHSYIW